MSKKDPLNALTVLRAALAEYEEYLRDAKKMLHAQRGNLEDAQHEVDRYTETVVNLADTIGRLERPAPKPPEASSPDARTPFTQSADSRIGTSYAIDGDVNAGRYPGANVGAPKDAKADFYSGPVMGLNSDTISIRSGSGSVSSLGNDTFAVSFDDMMVIYSFSACSIDRDKSESRVTFQCKPSAHLLQRLGYFARVTAMTRVGKISFSGKILNASVVFDPYSNANENLGMEITFDASLGIDIEET